MGHRRRIQAPRRQTQNYDMPLEVVSTGAPPAIESVWMPTVDDDDVSAKDVIDELFRFVVHGVPRDEHPRKVFAVTARISYLFMKHFGDNFTDSLSKFILIVQMSNLSIHTTLMELFETCTFDEMTNLVAREAQWRRDHPERCLQPRGRSQSRGRQPQGRTQARGRQQRGRSKSPCRNHCYRSKSRGPHLRGRSQSRGPQQRGRSQSRGRQLCNPSLSRATSRQSLASCCYWCGGSPHYRAQCPAKKAKCWRCQKIGHFARVCRAPHPVRPTF